MLLLVTTAVSKLAASQRTSSATCITPQPDATQDTVASDVENQAPHATTPSVAAAAPTAVPLRNAAVPALSSTLRALGSVSNVASHTVAGTLDGAYDTTPVAFAPASTPLGLDPSAIATTGGQMAMLGVLREVRDLLRVLCRSLEGHAPLAAPTATQQPDADSPTAEVRAAEAAEALQRMRTSRQQRGPPPAANQVRHLTTYIWPRTATCRWHESSLRCVSLRLSALRLECGTTRSLDV